MLILKFRCRRQSHRLPQEEEEEACTRFSVDYSLPLLPHIHLKDIFKKHKSFRKCCTSVVDAILNDKEQCCSEIPGVCFTNKNFNGEICNVVVRSTTNDRVECLSQIGKTDFKDFEMLNVLKKDGCFINPFT